MPHNQPLRWRKSSKSGGNGGQCVELAHTMDAIRDSKNPGRALAVPAHQVRALVTAAKAGQLGA